MKKKKMPTQKKWWIFVIVASMVLATIFVFAKIYFSVERVVNYRLDSLAREYYEEYFYDKYTESSHDSVEETLSSFSERGFGKTFLRQLLVMDEEKGGNARKILDEKCNANKTYVMYYPKSPYGKTDYDFKYVYSCNFD